MYESEGKRWVMKDNKFGFIDQYGRLVVDTKYDWAENYYDGLALVGMDVENIAGTPCGGKWGYIDHEGTWIWIPTN